MLTCLRDEFREISARRRTDHLEDHDIPITDDGKLTGMISVRLILKYITEKLLSTDEIIRP